MEKYEQNQETKCITMAGQQYIDIKMFDRWKIHGKLVVS